MAQNSGTLVGGAIRPFDSEDTFPTALANEIKGGWHTGDYDTMIDLPVSRREWGMIFFLLDETAYILMPNFNHQTMEIISDLSDNDCWRALGLILNPNPLKLGETSFTAYRGDRGKTAYDHSQLTSGNPHNVTKEQIGLGNVTNHRQVRAEDVGQADGVAPLDSNKLIPSEFLPSYVDDVVDIIDFVYFHMDLPNASNFNEGDKMYVEDEKAIYHVESGRWDDGGDGVESDKIYIRLNDRDASGQIIITQWRWSGSEMVRIMNSALTLGETEYTAYRGDRGKAAYDHISQTNNPHGVTKSQVGLSNVNNTTDMQKPVSMAQSIAINAVQGDLNTYRNTQVGQDFPNYATQLTDGLNF